MNGFFLRVRISFVLRFIYNYLTLIPVVDAI
jgi:hypothetical protein